MPSRGKQLWAKYVVLDGDNLPLAGDLANHTISWAKDGGDAQATNNQGGAGKHIEHGNGLYSILITATETDCDCGGIFGISITSGAVVVPRSYTFEQPADVVTAFSDVYSAKVSLQRRGSKDLWVVEWYKNGVLQTSGVTLPVLTVRPVLDPTSPIVNGVSMNTAGAAYGYFRYTVPTDGGTRTSNGVAYHVTVTATIDGDTRTATAMVGRDA